MEGFKLFGGQEIDDVRQYVQKFIAENPDVKVFVGSDSQTHRRHIEFASVVCFQYPLHKGVHFVFKREKIKKKDFRARMNPEAEWKGIFYQRLWREVELSVELAEYIKDYVDDELIVDLDFNGSTKHESNKLYDAGKGFVVAKGFHCRLKPDAWAATYAADLVVK